jgi:actin related protein 2/3 complex subunit 5
MSIIQQHTSSSLTDAWRIINIDALIEDSSVNFDKSTLYPPQPEVSESDVRQISGQVRQLLRGGDAEGALRGCLETPVYNGTDAAKVRRRFFSFLAGFCWILAWTWDVIYGSETKKKGETDGSMIQDAHLHTIIEVLQSIKASEMSPLLKSIYGSEGGSDCLDVLMKYL